MLRAKVFISAVLLRKEKKMASSRKFEQNVDEKLEN
jgi:hypothetical protein